MDSSGGSGKKGGFFFGGFDIPDEQVEGLYGKEEVRKAREDAEAEDEVEFIERRHRECASRGRANPQREEHLERLIWIYDHRESVRASVIRALGELGCREASRLIGGIVRNWGVNLPQRGERMVSEAVGALWKVVPPEDREMALDALMQIVEDRAAPETLRGRAAVSAERVAAMLGPCVAERTKERMGICGAEGLQELRAHRVRSGMEMGGRGKKTVH